ncbi:MAG: hypothetical protein JSU00_22280 [Acidobacteria bacterium]|nr:hypothetical protein [Acidobacteriota bacterium]
MALTLIKVQQILSYIGPMLAAVLLFRLWAEGLIERYRFFALYLFCLAAELAVVLAVRQGSNRYLRYFIGVESVLWVVQILMIIEMFALIFHRFPGISRYWRKFMIVAFLIAIAASVGFALLNPQSGTGQYPLMERYLLISRVISFTILFFFGLLLVFLFWFPIPLSRNVVAYTIGFSVYFGSRPLMRLAGNLLGSELWPLFSCISELIVVMCLTFWSVYLTRRGESVDVTVGHRWQPDDGAVLIQQLQSINTVLLRTARK